jgi:hypothetical protein
MVAARPLYTYDIIAYLLRWLLLLLFVCNYKLTNKE